MIVCSTLRPFCHSSGSESGGLMHLDVFDDKVGGFDSDKTAGVADGLPQYFLGFDRTVVSTTIFDCFISCSVAAWFLSSLSFSASIFLFSSVYLRIELCVILRLVPGVKGTSVIQKPPVIESSK